MNQLYIIGNGFDLAHGMKTKYSDFILWYLNKVYRRLVTHGHYEDELLVVDRKHQLAEITLESIDVFLSMAKDKYFDLLIKSGFLQKILGDITINRWVDVEALYFNQLLALYSQRDNPNIKPFVKKLNNDFVIITALLKEYIGSIDIQKYLPHTDISISFTALLNKIEVGNEVGDSALFLNFNYTATLELYDALLKQFKAIVLHIHGKATAEKDDIIFGYGDEMNDHYAEIEKLNDNEYLRHFKSFNYFLKTNYRTLLNFIESGNFNVYIMGHSCGLSDRILLNSIFEHDHCKAIQIFYHDRGNGNNDFVEKTYEISRHFSGAKKGMMRSKILSFDSSDPLVRMN
jgi:hypothetical protein